MSFLEVWVRGVRFDKGNILVLKYLKENLNLKIYV